jgi:hypothetical protein
MRYLKRLSVCKKWRTGATMKLILENWREYLKEDWDAGWGEQKPHEEEEPEEAPCTKISEYLHLLGAVAVTKDDKARARKQAELEGLLARGGTNLSIGTALTIATGGAALPFAIAASATHGLGELAYDIAKNWRNNQPPESVLANNPFLDALDWHPKFTDRLSNEILEEVMNAY